MANYTNLRLALVLCAMGSGLALKRVATERETPWPPVYQQLPALRFSFLEPPSEARRLKLATRNQTAIVTYAGFEKQQYIDGAVMLGRSVRTLDVPKVCLVDADMKNESQQLLTNAGWLVWPVPHYKPKKFYDFPKGKDIKWWSDAHTMIEAFRLPYHKVVFMEADVFVSKPDQLHELLNAPVDHVSIAMVKDCCNNYAEFHGVQDFNTGVMVFRPNPMAYQLIRDSMWVADNGFNALPQPNINAMYKGHIKEMDRKWNMMGSHGCQDEACAVRLCGGAVVAHFTGPSKPASSALTMEQTPGRKPNIYAPDSRAPFRLGPWSEPYLYCPNLYEEFFCAMENNDNVEYLSREMRTQLTMTVGECKDDYDWWHRVTDPGPDAD